MSYDTYPIKTKEFHEAALAGKTSCDPNVDPMDNGLSSWGSDSMASYHTKALEVIANGMADLKPALFKGDEEISATLDKGSWGYYWHLSSKGMRQLGWGVDKKPFLPSGPKSKVLKGAGLQERRILKPVKPFFNASCAGVGSPVIFHTQL